MIENLGRQLVIGDIHNGLRGLIQVWERAKVTTDDTIIFLGDIVDGWGDAPELVEHLIKLNEEYNCIFIRGNHDYWFEGFLTTRIPYPNWLNNGGVSTKTAYENSIHNGKTSHVMFFYKMHKYYIDDKNRLFVHGGYTSEKGVEGDDSNVFYWNRDLFELAFMVEERTRENPKERARCYPKRLKVYDEVFVGHTTTSYFIRDHDQPINALNMWNLDTGAGSNGRLTIMDCDTKEYWQSDKLTSLYPDDPHNEFCNKRK